MGHLRLAADRAGDGLNMNNLLRLHLLEGSPRLGRIYPEAFVRRAHVAVHDSGLDELDHLHEPSVVVRRRELFSLLGHRCESGTEFFDWANVLENAPEPSSARKTPIEQRIKPRMIRESKKADCGVVFVFISEFFFYRFGKDKTFGFGEAIKMGWYLSRLFYYEFVMSRFERMNGEIYRGSCA